jgi:hypothetical protein
LIAIDRVGAFYLLASHVAGFCRHAPTFGQRGRSADHATQVSWVLVRISRFL